MFDELQSQFSTTAGRRQFSRDLGALIRIREFEQAEQILAGCLTVTGAEFALILDRSPLYDCDVFGWDDAMEAALDMLEGGMDISALGLSILDTLPESHGPGQPLPVSAECHVFGDTQFPFSRMSQDELIGLSGDDEEGWAAYSEGVAHGLRISGLDQLHAIVVDGDEDALFADDGQTPTQAAIGWFLSTQLFALRIHQLAHQLALGEGTLHAMPLLMMGQARAFIPESAFCTTREFTVVRKVVTPVATAPLPELSYDMRATPPSSHPLRHRVFDGQDLSASATEDAAAASGGGLFGRLFGGLRRAAPAPAAEA